MICQLWAIGKLRFIRKLYVTDKLRFMNFFQHLKQGRLPLGRIEAFSDGIFAVAATLLVLDLKDLSLPANPTAADMWQALVAQLPKFLSWLISFIIVCKFWLNHHHLLRLARHADYGMVWLNSIFLMFQSLVPFPTSLMGEYPKNPLAVGVFGIIMAFNTLLFMLLYSYILKHLLNPQMAGTEDPHVIRKSFIGPLSYLIGVGVAWINTDLAFVVYFITPLFFITPVHKKGSDELPEPAPSAD
jgi:uncharacterized membrane protein